MVRPLGVGEIGMSTELGWDGGNWGREGSDWQSPALPDLELCWARALTFAPAKQLAQLQRDPGQDFLEASWHPLDTAVAAWCHSYSGHQEAL